MMTHQWARFALGLAALAALAGCGGGGGGGGPAATPPAPAPAPAPTPAPVKVQSLQPADGSTKVDIRPTLQVVLDGAIDASSVTSAHVQLLSNGYPQLVTLSYDATSHTIAIAPGTLAHDTSYTLAVSGLVDSQGKTVAASQATFSTWVNAQLDGHKADGTVLFTSTLDATGHPTLGPNNADGTGYETFTYLPNGRLSETEVWGTGYDFTPNAPLVLESSTTFEYEANGALHSTTTHYPAVGAGLSHDVLATFSYDDNGRQTSYVSASTIASPPQMEYHETVFDDQGIDIRSLDASDSSFAPSTLYSYSVRTPADGSTPERLSRYKSAGPDGQLFTADDVLGSYVDITRDGRGNVIRMVEYRHATGAAPTDPLVVDDYTIKTYDAHDNLVQSTDYIDPGPDGLWFTADDVVSGIYDYDTTH